jgi:hypothetical protein
MLAIVLSVRQFKAPDYPFGIIKLFLAICNLSTEFILYVTRKRIVYVLLQVTLYYCCFVFYSSPTFCLVMIDLGVIVIQEWRLDMVSNNSNTDI